MENSKLKENIRFLAVGAAGANVAQMMEKKGYKAYYVNLVLCTVDIWHIRLPSLRVRYYSRV